MLLLALACLALVAGCGDDNETEADSTPAAEQTETPVASAEPEEAGCEEVEAPEPGEAKKLSKPKETLDKGTTYVAKVETSCGDFEITLDSKDAPKTGGSFKYLVEQKFFDGLIFHRIVPGFVIQGGDPEGNGQGGPGYSVVEAPPEDLTYTKGVVAMAKTATEAPGTSGSQFFVVTGEDAGLPPEYALLGKVTKGQEVVDAIGVVQTDPSTEQPVTPVVMQKVTITEKK